MSTRKKPIRHTVRNYMRQGKPVHSYTRGNGTKVVRVSKLSTRYLGPRVEAEYIGTVADIQNDPRYKDYSLATDSQDVEAIWDHFGNDPTVKDFDGFFIDVKDGDYVDVLGFPGNVPYLYKSLYRIVLK